MNEYGFVIDGKPVYPEYSDSVHYDPNMGEPVPGLPIYRGWDFGLTPGVGFLQVLPGGRINLFDELVAEYMFIDEFSDQVNEHCGQHYPGFEFIDVGDDAGEQNNPAVKKEQEEKTCFDILQAKGIAIEGVGQNQTLRKGSIKKALKALVKGKPRFMVGPKAKTCRKALMGGYMYERVKTKQGVYKDKPNKNMYSHVIEGVEYVMVRIMGEGLTTSSQSSKHLGPKNPKYNTSGII
jgi:hypothetical protein